MQNGIESINYEHSVNVMTEEVSRVYDDGYRFGRRCAIGDVIQLLNEAELAYYNNKCADSAKVCARLREAFYDL